MSQQSFSGGVALLVFKGYLGRDLHWPCGLLVFAAAPRHTPYESFSCASATAADPEDGPRGE